MKLPALNGSQKQIEWAEDLRKEFIANAKTISVSSKYAALANSVISEILKKDSCRWWIDNYGDAGPIVSLLSNTYDVLYGQTAQSDSVSITTAMLIEEINYGIKKAIEDNHLISERFNEIFETSNLPPKSFHIWPAYSLTGPKYNEWRAEVIIRILASTDTHLKDSLQLLRQHLIQLFPPMPATQKNLIKKASIRATESQQLVPMNIQIDGQEILEELKEHPEEIPSDAIMAKDLISGIFGLIVIGLAIRYLVF